MTAVAGGRIRPSRSNSYHFSVRLVSRWAAYYSRDLESQAAAERRDEIASDLWEQGSHADARGASSLATGASILWRTARGVPADLSWRRSRLSRVASTGAVEPRGWSGRGGLVAAAAITAAVLTLGVSSIARVLANVIQGVPLPSVVTVASASLASVLLACGMILLLRVRTRWLGAAWIGAIAPIVVLFGSLVFIELSATAQWYYYSMIAFGPSWWAVVSAAGLAALVLFYLALAVAWFPDRSTRPAGGAR